MKTGELRLVSYNIAGLPVKSLFEGRSVQRDAAEIGRQVRAAGYDLLAVQEDFSNYRPLRRALGAPHYSFSKGNVPAGDGLDVFSQRPIYNVARVPWARSYGGFTYGAADEYTPKGFMRATMALAPGAYVDIYNLHAVAGAYTEWEAPWHEPTTAGEVRRAGFEQLRDYIQEHSAGRALILLGDFNSVLWKVPDGLYDTLIEPLGLKDTWAELFNGGKMAYDGQGDWQGGATRDAGSAEHIDKILYRSGGAVEFTVAEAAAVPWITHRGRSLSDHDSWTATLRYTITNAREDGSERLRKPEPIPAGEKLRGYATGIRHDAGVLKKEMPVLLGRENEIAFGDGRTVRG